MKLSGATLCILLSLSVRSAWPSPVTECGKPADVVFLIDVSTSIWIKNFREFTLPFIQNVVSAFNVGPAPGQTRVAAVTFGNDVRAEFDLSTYQDKNELINAIGQIDLRGGSTYTDKALKYTRTRMFEAAAGGRPDVARVIIVVTDGESSNRSGTIIEAEAARRFGANIFAIGVGNVLDDELALIASQPTSQFKFKVTDYQALDGIKKELAYKACKVTKSTPAPTTTTTTTTTTEEAPANDCGGRPADIFFILDSSSSIWQADFEQRMLGFLREVVGIFSIGSDLTRVGVMTFSDRARVVIGLDDFENKNELLSAISPDRVRYTMGGTNTAAALREVRSEGFGQAEPRGNDVARIAVVITDGQSWSAEDTKNEAHLLKESGVVVYAIGVGKGVKQTELEAIANKPGEQFVFRVDNFAGLSEIREALSVKTCDEQRPQGDQPICGDGATEITFAFDASTMSGTVKRHTIDQIRTVSNRLTTLSGDVKIGVTSGDCPLSLDIPMSEPDVAAKSLRHSRRHAKSNIHSIVKSWRKQQKMVTTSRGADQGLVLLLTKENVSDFDHLTQEVAVMVESGVKVLVLLDHSVDKYWVDRWIHTIGQDRVVGGIHHDTEYSGYVMEFVCS